MTRVALATLGALVLGPQASPAVAFDLPFPFAAMTPAIGTPVSQARRAGRPARATRAGAAPGSGGLSALIAASAARHAIPLALAHAIIRIESGYRCTAHSRGGARGLMQVLPQTAHSVGVGGNLFECATGLEAGMRYLRLALAAGGPGCVGASLYNSGLAAGRRCTAYGRRAMSLSREGRAGPSAFQGAFGLAEAGR